MKTKTAHYLLAMLLAFLFPASHIFAQAVIVKERENYDILLDQMKNRPQFESKFTPVQIFRTNLAQTASYFSGTGSLLACKDGAYVITCAHLFKKEWGVQLFGFRKVVPFEADVTHGITGIIRQGAEFGRKPGDDPDIILVQAQTGTATPITGSWDKEGVLDLHNTFYSLVDPEITEIRSLISGRWVRLVGTTTHPTSGTAQYYLAEYESRKGESGTGFVDKNDSLYILTTQLDLDPGEEVKVKKVLKAEKHLSLVYGPISFR